MGTNSNLAEDLVAVGGENMLPSRRPPRVVDNASTGDALFAPAVEAEDSARSPGRGNRLGLMLAVVVVTIGPCGALLVALGSPHLGPNIQPQAVPVAASPPLQLVLDDQPSPLPDLLPAPPPVTVTDDIVDKPMDHAPTHIASRSFQAKRHSARHTVIASDRPVTRIASDDQHGGPYARTGNGPGNFFSGTR
jgi:hypothetical protein